LQEPGAPSDFFSMAVKHEGGYIKSFGGTDYRGESCFGAICFFFVAKIKKLFFHAFYNCRIV
jgi:hypothetical protein